MNQNRLEASMLLPKAQPIDRNLTSASKDEIRKVSEEFESLFLSIVLKSMRDTVTDSGLFETSNATKIYTSMLDDEYAKLIAADRQTGIADSIESFLKIQNQSKGQNAYKK